MRSHLKRCGDALNIVYRDVSLAPLHRTDVGSVEAARIGKRFL